MKSLETTRLISGLVFVASMIGIITSPGYTPIHIDPYLELSSITGIISIIVIVWSQIGIDKKKGWY